MDMRLLDFIRTNKKNNGFANVTYETRKSFAYCEFNNKLGIEKYFNEFGNFTLTIWL